MRVWAFWRRVQYGTAFGLFWLGVFVAIYFVYFAVEPTCFDNVQNADERGIDCGGSCVRICPFEVVAPTVTWARAFPGNSGLYNAVAYIENKNRVAATPELRYTVSLYDAGGLITERKGSTILPPDGVYPIFEDRIDTFGRVPSQIFIEIEASTMWVPATEATEQLTVTSRQLSGVDTKPRLNAIIKNETIDDSGEVEVIATIFDRDGNALTASRTYVENIAGVSEEEMVFTWPNPIAKTLRSCEVPTDVVLAIDLSGSMNNDGGTPPEPVSSVLKAAHSFVTRLNPDDQVGLVTFATNATTVAGLTTNHEEIAKSILSLQIDPKEETGNTNTGEGIAMAGQELTSLRHNVEARKVLILLTDGLATAPEEDPELYAQAVAQVVKAQDTIIYAIGLGESVNMEFVSTIASDPSQAFKAVTVEEVEAIYRSITGAMCEQGPSVIQIVPKSDAMFAPLR